MLVTCMVLVLVAVVVTRFDDDVDDGVSISVTWTMISWMMMIVTY
jgi:hypothetical protein